MSLFPAYSHQEVNNPTSSRKLVDHEKKIDINFQWLTNSSFMPTIFTGGSINSDKIVGRHQKKKKQKKDKRKNYGSSSFGGDGFVIDKECAKDVLSSNAKRSSSPLKNEPVKKKKRRKKNRYFSKPMNKEGSSKDEIVDSQMEVEEFLKLTESYNVALRENPNDVNKWLEYIKLQDRGEGTLKGIAEKKLSIIEKALSSNTASIELLHEKFSISEKVLPTDKMASEAKLLVTKDSNNEVGWNWLLKCNQFTLSRMTVPSVLETYSSMLQGFHKMNRNTKKMIETVLHCGLFLRQSGLWEQLWAYLEHYLELNLADPGSGVFSVHIDLPEDEIKEIEDTVITCGLPLGALWLRIEHLRELVHFLPIDNGEDPQRTVFPEDVSNLVFPVKKIVTPKLIAVILVLLKVPPLPPTDSFSDYIGLKSTNWAHESTEHILAACHESGIVKMDMNYILVAKDLIVGPQYMNEKLGEAEFYTFVDKVFENCGKNADANEKDSIFVWQLRWWRWVAKLRGKDSKELQAKVKRLLKQRRDCILLYIEYALLELECGDPDAAFRVLETALSLRGPPLHIVRERAEVAHLYRVYIEALLKKTFHENRNKAVKVLIALAFGKPVSEVVLNDENIEKAKDKFKHLTIEIIEDVNLEEELKLTHLLMPDFCVSWLACHVWFLYLTQNIWEGTAIAEKAISAVSASKETLGYCILENYYEVLVDALHHFCTNNAGHFRVLEEALSRSCQLFPDNVHFLSISASIKMDNKFFRDGDISNFSTLGNIFQIFVFRDKMMKLESQESGIGKNSGFCRKIYNFLKKMSENSKTEYCPLIWRLIIQFVAFESPDDIKKVFYQAVEKCPWVKSLYYVGAQILPEELGQIQDLLVEKELRLHITPEEIEILREDEKEKPP